MVFLSIKSKRHFAGITISVLIVILLSGFTYELWKTSSTMIPVDINITRARLSEVLKLVKHSVMEYVEEENRLPQSNGDLDISTIMSKQDDLLNNLQVDSDGAIHITFSRWFWADLPPDVQGKKIILEPRLGQDEQGRICKGVLFHCQTVDVPTKYLESCVTLSFAETVVKDKAALQARQLAFENEKRKQEENNKRILEEQERRNVESHAALKLRQRKKHAREVEKWIPDDMPEEEVIGSLNRWRSATVLSAQFSQG